MHQRFVDSAGRSELRGLVSEQKLFAGIDPAVDAVAAISDVDEVIKGKQIYAEDEPVRRVLYLVFGGRVDVSRSGKRLATLGRGDFFGEFPLLDPAARYTVSAVTAENCLIARVPWGDFAAYADAHPRIWRNMAAELAQRLRGLPGSSAPSPDQSEPKSFQEAVLRWARRLPNGTQIFIGVLAALCVGVYLLWQSLPDTSRSEFVKKFAGAPTAPAAAPQPAK